MDFSLDWIHDRFGIELEVQSRIITSLIVILLLVLVRQLVLMVVMKRTDDRKSRYQWKKSSLYIAVLVGVLVVGRTWFTGFSSLVTYLGLLSAGLAIALKDPITNLVGWMFILWRKPFDVGDRIQIGSHIGDVIDQRVFQFSILEIGNWVDADQSTGRIIHIPNGRVFSDSQANYTQGFSYIWNEIPVLVTFESDWKLAKRMLQEVIDARAESISSEAEEHLREASRRYMITYANIVPMVYTSVQDSGVLLTIRYLCDPRNRRASSQEIWEDILDRFASVSTIDLAYPTQRFFNNRTEGKTGDTT